MNMLIHVTPSAINGAEVNSVNAKDIYDFLGVKSRFNDWIKTRLSDFLVGEDFIIVTKKSVTEANEYFLTLDTAKHISMLERNNKGREARQYFIDVEKQAMSQVSIPQNPMDALALFFDVSKEQDSRIKKLEDTKRLENWQEKSLKDAVSVRSYIIARKVGDPDNKTFISSLHRKIWSLFKKKFFLPRYNELPAIKYHEGLEFINSLDYSDMV